MLLKWSKGSFSSLIGKVDGIPRFIIRRSYRAGEHGWQTHIIGNADPEAYDRFFGYQKTAKEFCESWLRRYSVS